MLERNVFLPSSSFDPEPFFPAAIATASLTVCWKEQDRCPLSWRERWWSLMSGDPGWLPGRLVDELSILKRERRECDELYLISSSTNGLAAYAVFCLQWPI